VAGRDRTAFRGVDAQSHQEGPERPSTEFGSFRASEDGSAGLYGLADSLGLGVKELTLGVRSPCQAGELVNGGCISGSSGSGVELFGKYGFSVRDQVPPKGRARFQAKLRRCPKKGACVGSNFRGVSGLPRPRSSPALPGHRPALYGGFCVSRLRILQAPRIAVGCENRLVPDSRQRWAFEQGFIVARRIGPAESSATFPRPVSVAPEPTRRLDPLKLRQVELADRSQRVYHRAS
jgi:hypothetical protein